MTIKNRIKSHRRVRAGDLIAHEFNFRSHGDIQKAALRAIYEEIGFARSLLAYELPDGRLKLIDGHLRRDLDPDMEVEVEILDVTDAEARALLLSIDPLASLAENQAHLQERLLSLTPTVSPDLRLAWEAAAAGVLPDTSSSPSSAREKQLGLQQYLIMITCRGDKHQRELIERFQAEGLDFRTASG